MVLPPLPNSHKKDYFDGSGMCAVSYIREGGTNWELDSSLPCHGIMNRTPNMVGFATSLRTGEDSSYHQAQRFWRWLFKGVDSPYRTLSHSGDFVYCDQELCGYVWYELGDWDKNYMMHLLMASRIPQEFHSRLRAWEKLQDEHGMSPLQAYFLIHYVSYTDGQWVRIPGESLHSPFHAAYDVSFKALRKAKPVNGVGRLVRQSGMYGSVNQTFIPENDNKIVVPMIKQLFVKPEENKEEQEENGYKGPFVLAWKYKEQRDYKYQRRNDEIANLNLGALDWEKIYDY